MAVITTINPSISKTTESYTDKPKPYFRYSVLNKHWLDTSFEEM